MTQTVDALKSATIAWLGIPADGTGPDVTAAGLVAPAVFEFVDGLPSIRRAEDVEGAGWRDDTWLAAVMLAARLVRRRNSPQGVAAFTEQGGAAYVSRHDPDVAQMLRIGSYAAPQVG